MTTQPSITGTETTRELLNLRRAHVRGRRQRKAALLTGEFLPLAELRPIEPAAKTNIPKIA